MTDHQPPPDPDTVDPAWLRKLDDARTPGFAAEFDPEEAVRAGAFVEDALTEEEASDSALDLEGAWALHAGQGA